ncbi:hypothetical protein HPB51_015044 [Rhipicephalus microplus]|uniref:Uncharacterized protein n=1 Tax=Rhipicephalus microplus TaxID=6941 RepID=A0A9J6ETK7_RHIMP|nr:hypothetical protein HPB51_015044 [Rhipicephalus microplus]
MRCEFGTLQELTNAFLICGTARDASATKLVDLSDLLGMRSGFSKLHLNRLWVLDRNTAPICETENNPGNAAQQSLAANTPSEPSVEPPIIPPVNQDDARGLFKGSTIDYTAACTATEQRACHIARHLAAWNKFLLPYYLELRDDSSSSPGPGRLSLVSCDKPSLRYCTPDELHLCATVVNALLKTHVCVIRVAIVHTWSKSHVKLVGEAIRYNCNASLRYLTLGFERFSDHGVWSVLSSLVQLEELECLSSEDCPDEFFGTLSMLLRKTKSLRVLKIPELRINRRGLGPMFMERPSRHSPAAEQDEYQRDLVVIDHDTKNYVVERFLQALKENSTLKELSLNESVVSEASNEAFEGYMTKSGSLTAFSVMAGSDLNRFSTDRVLKALLKNTSLTKVTLIGLVYSKHSARLVQRVLEGHQSLRSFEVSVGHQYSSERLYGHSPRTEFDDWLVALIRNDVMEEVTFTFHMPFVFSAPDKWEAFAIQLPTRVNLKKVTIVAYREDVFQSVLCSILRQNGAEDKVSFQLYNVHESIDLLQYRTFSGVYACVFQNYGTHFQRLLKALPSLHHVTTVHLDMWMSCIDETLSYSVVECIEAATSIRELRLISSLHDQSTTDHWAAVIDSLSRNEGLRELRLQARVEDPRHASIVARVVNGSRHINKVHFNVGGTLETAALVRCLSEGIGESYNLVSVSVNGMLEAEEAIKDWFVVRETTRRNCSLVICATRFLTADECWDRNDAAALEQVPHRPAILSKIADDLHISEADLAFKVRHKLRMFEDLHTFMRLAGVVSSRVECHRGVDGASRTQLDDLNEHCWLHVRRYLMLDDIEDHAPRCQ